MIIVVSLSCNHSKGINGFEIDGTIVGFDSAYVSLCRIEKTNLVTLDSAWIENGKFVLNGNVEAPELFFLIFGDDMKHSVNIFVENSQIQFKAHYDSLSRATIFGSKSHTSFKSYEDEMLPFDNKMADLYQQYKAASDQNNGVLMNQIDSTRQALNKDMETFIVNYIGSHRKSPVAPYILYKVSDRLSVQRIDSFLRLFDDPLKESVYSKYLEGHLQNSRNTEIGDPAPDFKLQDTSGIDVTLSSFKGKIVLIDFWASWSIPGRLEYQAYSQILNDFGLYGFEIIGISMDKDRRDWKSAVKSDKLPGSQLSDFKFLYSGIAELYGVTEIPGNFLIDKHGTIVGKNLGPEELKVRLLKLVN